MADKQEDILSLTAHVVAAYVSKNPIPMAGVPDLIASISDAFGRMLSPEASAPVEAEKPKPAVNPKKSVFPDYIVSLEDGQKFKSLRRALMTRHGMTPEQYREKWGLPSDYPMVAPAYSAKRSEMAKSLGLGRKPKEQPPEPAKTRKPRKAKAEA